MDKLESARLTINRVDKQMAELFVERMNAAKEVADYKKTHGLPIDDFEREEEIISKNSQLVEDSEIRSYYISFLRKNIELSKKLQHKMLDGMRVAYSGVEGAFANISAEKIFPDAKLVAFGDFKAAYKSVENGECDCVLLPVENSYNGDVASVLDLMFFGPLYVSGIYEAEIVQNLVGVKGASLDTIKTVISHSQALGQCAGFIEEKGYKTKEAVNTAVAAKEVAEMQKTDIAAIASREAADKFGLKILAPHINASGTNSTRFAVLTREMKTPSKNDNRFIMLFTVNNAAGSLSKAISVIGENGFNLIALKSRPTKELVWNYYFYAEGEGNINSEKGKKMVDELKDCCSNLKIVASFEKEIRI